MRTIAPGVRPSLQTELGDWLEASPRFADFVTSNQDKIRKKLSTTNEEARQDVRAELLVAHSLLSNDRRFAIAFEAYGVGQVGPDFTVTFRANQQFNVEVTRLRTESEPGAEIIRLANVIAGKLRQLRNDRPNALVVAAPGLAASAEPFEAALRHLKSHTDASDDTFFIRRGFKSARDFHVQSLHLSGIFALDTPNVAFVPNREARRPLGGDIVAAMTACLAGS